jgi:hypothetical protein
LCPWHQLCSITQLCGQLAQRILKNFVDSLLDLLLDMIKFGNFYGQVTDLLIQLQELLFGMLLNRGLNSLNNAGKLIFDVKYNFLSRRFNDNFPV